MKKVIFSFLFICVLFVISEINSNPIMLFYINEFMFDSTGWKMELHPSYFQEDSILLDGWFLACKTDTAFFVNGLFINPDDYKVISQSDLQSQLDINRIGDSLLLYDQNGEYPVDRIYFGTLGSYAPVPKLGQSICLKQQQITFASYYFYYLDNSPTLGFENDTINAMGHIDGYIKDSLNNPIPNTKVIYGYIEVPPHGLVEPVFVETNPSGYFNIYSISIERKIEFEKDGYYAPDSSIQIWPDSTVSLDIFMQPVVGVTELPSPQVLSFDLSPNYPNPFNNSTIFNYTIIEDGFIEINIYDEKGELIQKLFKGSQSRGKYKVTWNADNLASGIYFYELKTKNQKLTKKCLLLK